jgi:hypothetical protein
MKEYDARRHCGAVRRAQLESFALSPWTSRRRQDLLEVLNRLNPTIDESSTAVEQEAKKTTRGATADDTSWCWFPHCPCFCADHRIGGALCLNTTVSPVNLVQ